jgi:fumarate reductase (CoM/CoB) subunit A
MQMSTVQVDVIVIGGGGAGLRAALEASASGAKVALINKMQLGVSGATAFRAAVIGQYQAVGSNATPGDSFETHMNDIVSAGQGMADEKLVRILVEEAPERIVDLERWGVSFEKKEDQYHIIKGCFASIPRSHVLKDHGYLIARGLEQAVRADASIQVFEHTMVTNLLMQEGRCVGVLSVNHNNEWIVIEAGAVVMAAGGASRIFQHSMYPNDITGESYSLGFEAGALLANIEFVQLGLVLVHPRGGAVNTWTWRMSPRIYNQNGEHFLPDYLPSDITFEEVLALKANHWPFTNSDASCAIEIAVQDQILQGHASPRGGIYVDFTHVGDREYAALPDTFKPVWNMMVDNFKKRRIDLSTEPLEAVVGSHSVNGGYVIDEFAATTVPGLYACGECSAGMHGADRLGGNNLPNGQVFGRRAGRAAAAFALGSERGSRALQQAEEHQQDWVRLRSFQPRASESDVRSRLRHAVSQALCTNRSDAGIAQLLHTIQALEEELTAGIVSRKGFMPLCELRHMIQSAKLIATAARERKETRGPHHRRDYPEKDAAEAMPIMLRRGRGGHIQLTREHFHNKGEKSI